MLLNGCYRAAEPLCNSKVKEFEIKVFLRLSEVYLNLIDTMANRERFDAVKRPYCLRSMAVIISPISVETILLSTTISWEISHANDNSEFATRKVGEGPGCQHLFTKSTILCKEGLRKSH